MKLTHATAANQMKKFTSRGFTLIELLVVIAIIGILASIVLVNLNSARSKGTDAKIKSEVSSARGQAELYYSSNNNFSSVCTTAASSDGLLDIKNDLISTAGGSANVTCQNSASAWVMQVKLTSTPTAYACADSTGVSTTSPTTLISGGTDYAC